MRRWLKRGGLVLLGLALCLALVALWWLRRPWPEVSGRLVAPGLQDEVEVLRDRWGTPHLYARSSHDLFFAQGYVHAQDRRWQMDFNRRVGRGRISEIAGADALDFDRFTRTVGLVAAAEREWAAMDAEGRAALTAYADGVNAYVATHRGRLALEFTLLEVEPEPWQPVDSLLLVKLMYWVLSENGDFEISRARLIARAGEEVARQLLPPYSEGAPVILPPGTEGYGNLGREADAPAGPSPYRQVAPLLGTPGPNQGSNGWVLSGSRTTTGRPILANDSHLELFMPSAWYANGLHGDGFEVVGYSLAGAPGVVIGHNEEIGWGITDLVPDVEDLYVEQVDNRQDPRRYQFRGEWRDLEVERQQIPVKGEAPVDFTVYRTHHGPLLNFLGGRLKDAEATSQAWTGDSGSTVIAAVLSLNRARDWTSFRAALSQWDGPQLNFVYADRGGNIGLQATGLIPIRAPGHQGAVPVPGWTGEFDWQGFIPFADLPYRLNPPAGFAVAANNKLVTDAFPYQLGYEWADPYRFLRISGELAAHPHASLQDQATLQGDTYHLPAEALRPYLLAVKAQDELQREALAEVAAWDLRLDPRATGAAIYQVWYRRLVANLIGDELGPELTREYTEYYWVHGPVMVALMAAGSSPLFDDVTTPGRETREDIAQRAFVEAVAWLAEHLGGRSHEWQWGRIHTLTMRHRPLGFSGIPLLEQLFSAGPMPSPAGDRFTVNAGWFTVFDDDAPYAADAGAAQRMILDFSDWDHSLAVNSSGQSEHLFHPHRKDELRLWRQQQYHPLPFSRDAVAAAAGGRQLHLLPEAPAGTKP